MKAASAGRRRRPAFSVVSIVRNEADRLPRLLASLEDFRSRGGEVVIVDTGSTDGTERVAREAGCRVFVEPRRFGSRLSAEQARRIHEAFAREGEGPILEAGERLFHFARARNHARSLAANDFQVAVDGGDVVEALDIDFLDTQIRAGRYRGFEFVTRNRARTQWFLEIRNYFYDRRAAHWLGHAHNFVAPLDANAPFPRWRLTREQLLVAHHTDLVKPRGYQIAGVALEALRPSALPRWEFLMGRELGARGFHRSSLAILLSLDREGIAPTLRSAALVLAAHATTGSGGSPGAVADLLARATLRDPGRRDGWLHLSRHHLAGGDLQGAVSCAAAALSIPPRPGFPEPEDNHGTGPHEILYWALLWLGRRDEARRHFQICRKLKPDRPIYREHSRLFKPTHGRPFTRDER